jgi:hypothetical protein
MIRISGLLVIMMMACPYLFGQKQTQHINQVWFGYFNQARFSDKWGTWVDLHLRTKEDYFTNFSSSIVRLGVTYYANDQLKFTAGYAYVNFFPADNHSKISQPEHRPWQQVQWHTNSKRLRMMQWVRLEERYRRKIKDEDELGEGYNFNYRVRYNMFLMFPLSKRSFAPNTLSFVVNDEVHLNMGKEIVNNYFDQNRFFAGFTYHLNPSSNLQFGYMNVFQQLAAGNRYKSLHVPRVFFFQNLDLRKSKKHN